MVSPPEQFGANTPSLKRLPPCMRVSLRCIEGPPLAVKGDERRRISRCAVRHQPADEEGGRAALERLFDLAIERPDRIAQDGRAGLESGPLAFREALGAVHFGFAAEHEGEALLVGTQIVDGEMPGARDRA